MSLLSWHDIWVLLLVIVTVDAVLFGAIALGHAKVANGLRDRFWSRRLREHAHVAQINLATIYAFNVVALQAMKGLWLFEDLHRFSRPHFNHCDCSRCLHNAYWRTITGE